MACCMAYVMAYILRNLTQLKVYRGMELIVNNIRVSLALRNLENSLFAVNYILVYVFLWLLSLLFANEFLMISF